MAEDCRIPLNGCCADAHLQQDENEQEHQQQKHKSNSTQMPYSNPPVFPSSSRRIRTKSGWDLRASLSLLTLYLLMITLPQNLVCSLYLNCDSVQGCICQKGDEGGWRIECPNEGRFQYPIQLKVQRFDSSNNYEATLTIECDDGEESEQTKRNPWSFIKGMDLSEENLNSKIIKLEIRYCPVVQDGWSNLLKKVNLTGENILRFSFVTDNRFASDKPADIPSNFFENMPNIEILNLGKNKLITIPQLSSLKNLQSINLRSNNIQVIPQDAFTQNTQLNSIALTQNRIREISPGTFPDTLEHLELNQNQISKLTSGVFSNMRNLKRLFLNNNPLDDLEPNTFDSMPELEDLRLDNSKMTQLPRFENLPKLVTLWISRAIRSKQIPAPDGKGEITTTLPPEYLYMPENTLILRNLPSLQDLNLALNHFTSLPVLENLTELTRVDLRRNDLMEIENGAFAGLPKLKVLKLGRNKLKKLGSIRASSLTELDLSYNMLEELKNDMFLYLNLLKKLNLANNKIQNVAYKAFEPLSDLEELDLSNNNITFSTLSPYSSANIPEDYNFFGVANQSPVHSNVKLKYLNLRNNKVEKLFSDWSLVFTQINEINLSYNNIKSISANDLNFVSPNLTLNLENNHIFIVDMQYASLILADDNTSDPKEIRVLLGGNPLNCDCHAYGLKTFTSESYDLRIKNLSCVSPPELLGKKLVDVPEVNLVCDMEANTTGCPEPCSCRQRPVDETILIDCSARGLVDEEVPKLNTFNKQFSKWMVELDLSYNNITDFNNTAYIKEFLNKTKHIDLTGNKLTSTLFLERVGDHQRTTFALAENPFPCSNCAGFQYAWRAYPTKISDLGNVTCHKLTGDDGSSGSHHKTYDTLYVTQIKDFGEFCTNPNLSQLVVPLVIAVIFLSCLCVGLFVTIRYGWAIKAYLYSKGWNWCLFWERDLDEEDDGNEKMYDAFVSYSHKDEEWVIDELVNRLEGNEGFKLCLHFRDWTPGDWIPDQIVRSVDKSRRTIVVLSKNFVESVWSRLEFKAAHAQALKERSSRVILIMLGEDLKESDVQDDDLKMYMKMNTFMKWNDPLFWHRLKYALPHKRPTPPDENRQDAMRKMEQRELAIQLDKLRAKLEQNV